MKLPDSSFIHPNKKWTNGILLYDTNVIQYQNSHANEVNLILIRYQWDTLPVLGSPKQDTNKILNAILMGYFTPFQPLNLIPTGYSNMIPM